VATKRRRKRPGRVKGRLAKFVRGAIGFGLIILVLAGLASIYPLLSTADFFSYRMMDLDQDGIKNWKDADIDNDGVDNLDDDDSNGDYVTNDIDIVRNARDCLVGRRYDVLQKHFGDWGKRFGLMLDVDVIVISYEMAGIYLPRLMRADHAEHPDTYDVGNDNTPENSFFVRRVRNLFVLVQNLDMLERARGLPNTADIVFYDKPGEKQSPCHVALVSRITDDDRVFVIEGSVKHGVKELPEDNLKKRGYEPVYYGQLLSY